MPRSNASLSDEAIIQAARFRPLVQLFNYSQDVTRLIPMIKDKTEGSVNMYGVELELATDYEISDIVTCFDDPFLIAKSDGSVTGSKRNKLELVTTPCSLRTQRKYWAQFFNRLNMDKFDTSHNTNNGMHVHIGREAFCSESVREDDGSLRPSDFHIQKFSWFINNPANRWFMVETSERTPENISQYCQFVRWDNEANKSEKLFLRAVSNGTDRMMAVNHTKAPTIEVRMFKGIVSGATVLKNLEFVDAVVKFTRDASIKECTVPHFLRWLDETPRSQYRFLKKHITVMDARIIEATGVVLEAIRGLNKEKAFITINALAATGKVNLNRDIVDNINRVYERFNFSFNPETNRLAGTAGSKASMKEFDNMLRQYAR